MVNGNVILFAIYERILNHFCTMAEYWMSLIALFTAKLHPDFHSMCILEFHSGCYNLKLNMSVLFCKENNIPPGCLYKETLLIKFFMG